MAKTKYVPSGTMKRFIDVGKQDTRVVGAVDRFLLSKPRNQQGRRSDVIHPSDMISKYWCHRASYFHLLGKPRNEAKERHGLRKSLIFAEGNRIHDRWQNYFKEMNKLYGFWECLKCEEKFWGIPSEHGHEDYLVYKEVPLAYEPLKIQGHADGWLIDFGDPLLLEIKSIGIGSIKWENPDLFYKHSGDLDKMWKELNAPFYTHIHQVQVYLKLIDLIGLPNAPQEAVLIYESKGSQEVKEFVIPKSDFGVAPLFDSVKNIVEAVDKGTSPSCNVGGADLCNSCREYQ